MSAGCWGNVGSPPGARSCAQRRSCLPPKRVAITGADGARSITDRNPIVSIVARNARRGVRRARGSLGRIRLLGGRARRGGRECRARTAETPKQPSLCLTLRALHFYPDHGCWGGLTARWSRRRGVDQWLEGRYSRGTAALLPLTSTHRLRGYGQGVVCCYPLPVPIDYGMPLGWRR